MKLSIVTVHLNEFRALERTLDSLPDRAQEGEVQWILIDGASQTRSADEQQIMQQAISRADEYLSEPDSGVYDAMNKGTRLAGGEYVLYLNAGDELHPDFGLGMLQRELGSERPEMIWGICHERFESGELVKVKNRSPRLSWYGMPVNHQNVLFRTDLLGDSPYDTGYDLLADYDLIGRILNKDVRVHRTTVPIAIFQRGGKHSQNLRRTLAQEAVLRTKHFGVPAMVSRLLMYLKLTTAQIGKVPSLRRVLRRWI